MPGLAAAEVIPHSGSVSCCGFAFAVRVDLGVKRLLSLLLSLAIRRVVGDVDTAHYDNKGVKEIAL